MCVPRVSVLPRPGGHPSMMYAPFALAELALVDQHTLRGLRQHGAPSACGLPPLVQTVLPGDSGRSDSQAALRPGFEGAERQQPLGQQAHSLARLADRHPPGRAPGLHPAEATSASIRPPAASMRATPARTESSSSTSMTRPAHLPEVVPRLLAPVTAQPAACNSPAQARPMPADAPVTSAHLAAPLIGAPISPPARRADRSPNRMPGTAPHRHARCPHPAPASYQVFHPNGAWFTPSAWCVLAMERNGTRWNAVLGLAAAAATVMWLAPPSSASTLANAGTGVARTVTETTTGAPTETVTVVTVFLPALEAGLATLRTARPPS
jgi:hypothetical protein